MTVIPIVEASRAVTFFSGRDAIISIFSAIFRSIKLLGPKVKEGFHAELSMNFLLLLNVKMPTFVGISTFMSRKKSILGLSKSE